MRGCLDRLYHVTGNQLADAGHLDNGVLSWMLDARCWMLAAGCWMLDARCSMLDARCWMLDARCPGFQV
jgi:hypothetical protein